MRSGSALTSSLVRPLSTDAGWSSGSQPGTAYSSCLCTSSHCSSCAAVAGPATADQDQPAAQLVAVHVHVQLAGGDSGGGVVGGVRLPGAEVPHDHVARPVLAPRDHALEVEILDGSSSLLRGALHVGVQRGSPRDRPADQDAADLEAEVVVQPPRPVPLHHEAPCPGGLAGRLGGRLAGRLGRAREIPLALVRRELSGTGHLPCRPLLPCPPAARSHPRWPRWPGHPLSPPRPATGPWACPGWPGRRHGPGHALPGGVAAQNPGDLPRRRPPGVAGSRG